ncbi:MAG TPA: DNA polymerase III subunit chi [Alphaproteobacteria bacterium]
MTEIRFYHLQRTSEDRAIPQIAHKAYQSGKRVIIKGTSDEQVEKLNGVLWTFSADIFLPHGSAEDKFEAQQPVYLTAGNDNPNGAKIIITTPGCTVENPGAFDLCCEMLDGKNDAQIAGARTRWKDYKDKGFDVSYWQETEKGWEKKA